MKHLHLLILLGFLPLGPAAAQMGLPANSGLALAAQAYPSLKPLHPGTVFTAAVILQIKPGWHINAHEGLPEGFVPVDLKTNSSAATLTSAPRFPAGTP